MRRFTQLSSSIVRFLHVKIDTTSSVHVNINIDNLTPTLLYLIVGGSNWQGVGIFLHFHKVEGW